MNEVNKQCMYLHPSDAALWVRDKTARLQGVHMIKKLEIPCSKLTNIHHQTQPQWPNEKENNNDSRPPEILSWEKLTIYLDLY